MLFLLYSIVFFLAVFSYPGFSQIQNGPLPQVHQSPASCSTTQFYQSGNLSCIPCGGNQLVTEDGRLLVNDVQFKVFAKRGV